MGAEGEKKRPAPGPREEVGPAPRQHRVEGESGIVLSATAWELVGDSWMEEGRVSPGVRGLCTLGPGKGYTNKT